MHRTYPANLDTAIWALMLAERSSRRIQAALGADEAGIGSPLDVPLSTLKRRMAKLRTELGEPRTTSSREPGSRQRKTCDEPCSGLVRRRLRQLDRASVQQPLSLQELAALDRIARILIEYVREGFRERVPESQHARAGRARHGAQRAGWALERIARLDQDVAANGPAAQG